jgi:hypothetical protein
MEFCYRRYIFSILFIALIWVPGSASSGGYLANLSTRGLVTSYAPMTAGFIVYYESLSVTIRVAGPSLVNAGIADVLEDPKFTIYNSSGAIIGGNDDFVSGTIPSILTPQHWLEPATWVTLSPGSYTVVVEGVQSNITNDTSGEVVVELFDGDIYR